MPADLDLAALDELVAAVASDDVVPEAIVALRNAYPGLRALIDQQAAELERLRRVAACAERVHEQSNAADKCLWSWKDLATALAALRGEEDGR